MVGKFGWLLLVSALCLLTAMCFVLANEKGPLESLCADVCLDEQGVLLLVPWKSPVVLLWNETFDYI